MALNYSHRPVSPDIVDLLPSDPFGMGIETTFTAITGWLEDLLEIDRERYIRSSNGSPEGYDLFSGWNMIGNNSFKFQPFPYTIQFNESLDTTMQSFPGNPHVNDKPNTYSNCFPSGFQIDQEVSAARTPNTYGDERGIGTGLTPYDVGSRPACSVGDIVDFNNGGACCSLDMGFIGKVEGASEFDGALTYGDKGGMGPGLASYDIGFRPPCSVGDVEFNNDGACCSLDMGSIRKVEGASEFEGALTYGDKRGKEIGLASYGVGFRPPCSVGDVDFNNGSACCSLDMAPVAKEEGESEAALTYVLTQGVADYLGVGDLLSVESVCSSLLSVVRGDPSFWKIIHIDHPLNEKINDDILVQLVGRAQGKLECLSLVECPKVTDDGLRRVFEANRRITKLYVPGCTRISIECIVNCIRAYNCKNEFGGIKHVRIGGLFGVNRGHFEELSSLLGSGSKKIEIPHKPRFYNRADFYLPYSDDRAIDIERCPICEKFRLVYDCPYEGCKVKNKSPQACRACTLCIGRCAQCGRCINDTEFEETFCLELVCSDCLKQQHNAVFIGKG